VIRRVAVRLDEDRVAHRDRPVVFDCRSHVVFLPENEEKARRRAGLLLSTDLDLRPSWTGLPGR
jgi:hypothetical protein